MSKSACFPLSLTSQNLRENSSQVEVPEHGPEATEKPERPNCCANPPPGGAWAHRNGNLYSPYGLFKAAHSELQQICLPWESGPTGEGGNPNRMKSAINITNRRRKGESIIFPSLPLPITPGVLCNNLLPQGNVIPRLKIHFQT